MNSPTGWRLCFRGQASWPTPCGFGRIQKAGAAAGRLAAVVLLAGACAQAPAAGAQASERLPGTNLLVFRDKRGELRPVKSPAQWRQRRAEILRGVQEIMGPLRGASKRCPLDVQCAEELDCGPYIRRLISYQAEPGCRVPAYLLIPRAAFGKRGKLPAALALHPTDMQYGHRVTVEPLRDNYRAYAHDLALRGWVVLAPAYPLMANYHPDIEALGYRSGTMKAVWDNIRGLDLLESLPFVRRGALAAVGHSLGGHNAIFTAVFDARIKVVVSSCGFDSFLDYYGGDPSNWQPGRGWCQTRYMPALAAYRGRLAEIPFDFHELLGALAPRPVFVNAPLRDSNFQWRSVAEIVQAARQVYDLHGAPQRLRVVHPDCGHDFPQAVREEAYGFMTAMLP